MTMTSDRADSGHPGAFHLPSPAASARSEVMDSLLPVVGKTSQPLSSDLLPDRTRRPPEMRVVQGERT
jgi:hypothetical protein